MNDYEYEYPNCLHPQRRRRTSRRSKLQQWLKDRSIRIGDIPFIAIALSTGSYLILNEPMFVAVFGCVSILFLGAWHVARAIPVVERFFGGRVRFWHLASAIIACTAVVGVIQTPVDAIFLSGLENFMIDIAAEAGQAAGGEGIDESIISLIFNTIRGVFLLLVATAALFAYNQSQQGNDWRPIVTQIGLAFGIVIAIDVITYLFIGDGSGVGQIPGIGNSVATLIQF